MLPAATDPTFPEALKEKRLAMNLSAGLLANMARIDRKLVNFYENRDHPRFTKPRITSWLSLNVALGFNVFGSEYKDHIKSLPASLRNEIILDEIKTIEPDKPKIVTTKIETNWLPSSPYYTET